MFEQLLVDVLNKTLGDYVSNLDRSQLSVEIWSGNVLLRNLQLKREALDKFNLPIEVTQGSLGELSLEIPWANLKNQPVKVNIKNLFLVAKPNSKNAVYDAEKEFLNAQKVKQERLETVELLAKDTGGMAQDVSADAQGRESFTEQLVTKIVDNLQISISNIHIRYEDDLSNGDDGEMFSLGISLESIKAVSCDENWQEMFIQKTRSSIYKLMKLDKFSVYLDTHLDKAKDSWNAQSFTKQGDQVHDYLLQPVNGVSKLILRKVQPVDGQQARVEASLVFDELGIGLDNQQYVDLHSVLDYFNILLRSQYYKKYKPKELLSKANFSSKEKGKLLWAFARDATIGEIHSKNVVWSWEHMKQRRDDRHQYVSLWKKKRTSKLKKNFTDDDALLLKRLEEKLSFEDIQLYRSIADSELRKEVKAHESDYLQTEDAGKKTWYGYFFGPSNDSQKMLQELHNAIEYDESKAIENISIPDTALKVAFGFEMKKAGISLYDFEGGKRTMKLFGLQLMNLKASFIQRVKSMLYSADLASIDFLDSKNNIKLLDGKVRSNDTASDDKVFHFEYETYTSSPSYVPPLDKSIRAKMKPLKVFHSKKSIERFISFFKSFKKEDSLAMDMLSSVENSIQDGLKGFSTAGLIFAVEEHSLTEVSIDIEAPVFIFPTGASETEMMVVNLGHLVVSSEILSRDERERITSSVEKSGAEKENLMNLIYDRYKVKLHDLQAYVSNGTNNDSVTNIIEKTEFDIVVGLSILPSIDSITRVKLTGLLPKVRVIYSTENIEKITRVIKSFNYEEEETLPSDVLSVKSVNTYQTTVSNIQPKTGPSTKKQLEVTEKAKKDLLLVEFRVSELSLILAENKNSVAQLDIKNVDLAYSLKTFESSASARIEFLSFQDLYSDPKGMLVQSGLDENAKDFVTVAYNETISDDYTDAKIVLDIGNVLIQFNKPLIVKIIRMLVPSTAAPVSDKINADGVGGQNQNAVNSTSRFTFVLNVFGVKAIIQDGHKELCSMFFDHGAVCYKGDEVSVTTGRLTADSKEIGSILDIIRSEEANGQSSKEDMFKFNLKFQEKKIESWAASVLFVYNQSFLDNFISYWISFAAEISSPDNAVATQQDTSDAPSGFDYLLQVHLSTPIVVLKALESPDSLRIYLGNLEVNNDASDLPKLNMILSNISAKSFIEGNKRNIIKDSTINASLRIKSTGGVDLDMVSEELMMSVGKHQVRLLCDVVDMLSGQGQSTSRGEAIAKSEAGTSPSVAQVSSSETIIGLNIKRFQFDIMGKTDDVNISRLKISEIVFGFKMSAAASLIKASIRGLCLSDTRGDETICYREVIPCSEKSDINIEYDLTGSMLIIDVDKPVFIFVPDLVFTIRNLVLEAYSDSALAKKSASTPASNKAVSTPNTSNTAQFHYRIHIKNASVLLIRDTHVKNSDVLLVTVRECVLAQESILSFAVHEAMASMSQIEKEALHNFEADADSESRLGIIQKFDFTFIQDSRSSDSSVLKNIMSVDLPSQLNIFLSFRDIYLIRAFLDKLGEYTGENYSLGYAGQSAIETAKSYYMNNTGQSVATSINDKPLITNDESFHLNFNGLRLLLIDDLENFHLPVVEGVIEGIDLNASSWSEGLLSLSTTINLGLSYYNVKNSHWEPIVEPMNIQLDIVNNSVVNVTSENTLDFTLTTSLIETMSRLANQFSTDMNLNSISSSRTSLSAPFLIRNETGFKVKVSWESQNSLINEEEDIPWSFEDLRLIRKAKDRSLDSKVHKLTVEVKTGRRDLYFNQLTNVRIDRVGTTYYSLSPTVKDVSYSLQVDVALRGNIKVVSIRSTVVLVNYSNTSLEVLVEPNGNTNNNAEMFILEKGEKHCVSLRNILDSTIRFRPDRLSYSYSAQTLEWKNAINDDDALFNGFDRLLKRGEEAKPLSLLNCYDEGGKELYSMIVAKDNDFSRSLISSSLKKCPIVTFYILVPLEIENNLPYDVEYSLVNKTKKGEVLYFGGKGGQNESIPITYINLQESESLGLRLKVPQQGYNEWSDVVELLQKPLNKRLHLSHESQSCELLLDLHCLLNVDNIQTETAAMKLSLFAPYVVVNKTRFDFSFKAVSHTLMSPSMRPSSMFSVHSKNSALFSYVSTKDKHKRVKIGINNDHSGVGWSNSDHSFDGIGKVEEIVVEQGSNDYFVFALSSAISANNLTKMVVITPRFVVKNKTGLGPIDMKIFHSDRIYRIEQNESQAIYELKSLEDFLMVIRPKASPSWSPVFSFNSLGSIFLKVQSGLGKEHLLKVEVRTEGSVMYVILNGTDDKSSNWPFRIDNLSSSADVIVYQMNAKQKYKVASKSSMLYAWDEPSFKEKFLLVAVVDSHGGVSDIREVHLQELGPVVPLSHSRGILDLNVIAEGPTLFVLQVADYNEQRSLYKKNQVSAAETTKDPGSAFKVTDTLDSKLLAQFCFHLKGGIGLSLVNNHNEELLYLALKDIELTLREMELYQSLGLIIHLIEMDNQLYSSDSPIILSPAASIKGMKSKDSGVSSPKGEKDPRQIPTLQAALVKMKDESFGVAYFKYFSVLLQEMNIQVEESILFKLVEFFKHVMTVLDKSSTSTGYEETVQSPLSDEPSSLTDGDRYYFEIIQIQPVKLNITFSRSEVKNNEDDIKNALFAGGHRSKTLNSLVFGALYFAFDVLSMTIGNISDAPIRLNSLVLENTIATYPMYIDLISRHYTQQFLGQLHRVVGSADFLGNPVGLFNLVSSGVKDVFYEPYMGIVSDRPQDVGIGLAKGTASFLKKTVYGLSDTFSKFTGSVGKGLATATMDDEFMEERKRMKIQNRPKHAVTGLSTGASSFARSIVSGVTGIVEQPLRGAEKDGLGGFFKGIGKGIVGVVTKPVVGVFDLASSVTEGIKNTTTMFDETEHHRVRLPRHVGHDTVVKPFSAREAAGAFILKQVEAGKYEDEDYVCHVEIKHAGSFLLLVVTSHRILALTPHERRNVGGMMSVFWTISFEEFVLVHALEKDNKSVRIIFHDKSRHSGYPANAAAEAQNETQQVVNCGEERIAKYLENKIQEAYETYLLEYRLF